MAMLFKYPANLGKPEDEGNQHIITFVALKYNENRGKDSLGDEVNLYITGDALKTSYGQQYADVAMGAVGGFLMQSKGTEEVYKAMEGAVGSAAGLDIAGVIKNISGIGATGGQPGGTGTAGTLSTALVKGQMQQIRKGVAGAFPGAIEALDAKRGAVMNPHKALVYQGPGGFRTFSFNYKFSPASLDEAKAVANIVYFFKYHMHPSLDIAGGNAVGQSAGETHRSSRRHATMFKSINLKYPDEFLLEIKPRQKSQKDKLGEPKDNTQKNPLFRIDRCFLETCVVDYSTDGVPAFFQKDPNDGDQAYPVTTTLNLAFKETKILTREDIVEGY
jgi:hypothetical protein